MPKGAFREKKKKKKERDNCLWAAWMSSNGFKIILFQRGNKKDSGLAEMLQNDKALWKTERWLECESSAWECQGGKVCNEESTESKPARVSKTQRYLVVSFLIADRACCSWKRARVIRHAQATVYSNWVNNNRKCNGSDGQKCPWHRATYFLFHHKHVALKSEHQHFKVWLMHVGDINRPVHVYTRTDPS